MKVNIATPERLRQVREEYTEAVLGYDKDYVLDIPSIGGLDSKYDKLKHKFKNYLHLTIPGKPVSDSRPRNNTKTKTFYNPHKEEMKKIFKVIYNKDKTLRGIMIDKLMKVDILVYYSPTKKSLKYLSADDIFEEILPSIIVKDNDNVEKVHWDILQDDAFKILMDDNMIFGNSTFKFYSGNPRAEVIIRYCADNDEISPMYDIEMKNGITFGINLLSTKFTQMKGITEEDPYKYMIYITSCIEEYKLSKSKRISSKLKFMLSKLSAVFIDELLLEFSKVIPILSVYQSDKNRKKLVKAVKIDTIVKSCKNINICKKINNTNRKVSNDMIKLSREDNIHVTK